MVPGPVPSWSATGGAAPRRDAWRRLRPAATLRAGRRALLVRRRGLSALLVAVAVVSGLRAVAPPPPDTVPVTIAARDLAAGTRLSPGDLDTTRLAPAARPAGALGGEAAAGRVLAAPVRRGEPLTDARVTGPSLAAGYPGTVMLPVRLPDPDVAALLRVGDEVDLLATGAAGTRTVATARVAGLPAPEAETIGSAATPGRLVLLAVSPGQAPAVSQAAVDGYLTVLWTG